MKPNSSLFKEPGDKSVFRVPEGYFDTFTRQLSNRIDELEEKPSIRHLEKPFIPRTLERVRPLWYVAALFIVVLICLTTVLKLNQHQTETTASSGKPSTSTVDQTIQTQTAEDYLVSKLGTYSIAEYYVDPSLLEE
jgi:hypothetical protein